MPRALSERSSHLSIDAPAIVFAHCVHECRIAYLLSITFQGSRIERIETMTLRPAPQRPFQIIDRIAGEYEPAAKVTHFRFSSKTKPLPSPMLVSFLPKIEHPEKYC